MNTKNINWSNELRHKTFNLPSHIEILNFVTIQHASVSELNRIHKYHSNHSHHSDHASDGFIIVSAKKPNSEIWIQCILHYGKHIDHDEIHTIINADFTISLGVVWIHGEDDRPILGGKIIDYHDMDIMLQQSKLKKMVCEKLKEL